MYTTILMSVDIPSCYLDHLHCEKVKKAASDDGLSLLTIKGA